MKIINKYKYVALFIIFAISVLINFTYIKKERNGYEKSTNILRNQVEQLKKVPGSESVILEKEGQLTEINNDSFWINVEYAFFIMLFGTIAAIILSTFAQWGYTDVPFIRKKLIGEDSTETEADAVNYSRVLSAVWMGVCMIISVAIYVAFGS